MVVTRRSKADTHKKKAASGYDSIPSDDKASANASYGDDGKTFYALCNIAAAIVFSVVGASIYSRLTGQTLDNYGRFGNVTENLVVGLDPRLGWWLMELPCTVSFVYFFFFQPSKNANKTMPRVFAFIFLCHYLYRGWYFPYNIRVFGKAKNFDITIALGSWCVTGLHGYLNARWYAQHGKHLTNDWSKTLRFRLGAFMYYTGLLGIIYHDNILRDLRDPSGGGPRYKIPRGGLFDYSTCAQYFVELWAWAGFAIMSWGPNGLFIFFVSLANLAPRAVNTHAWYIEKFGAEYPAERKYLVPFVW